MANPGINSTAGSEASPTTQSLPDFTPQVQQPSPPLPPVSWEAINEQKHFYDVQDLIDPSPGLTSGKLKDREEDDVVIYDYSLDPSYLRSELPAEEGGPSSRPSSVEDDLFFRVSKNSLMESDEFDQIINSTKEPLSTLSRGSRLVIMGLVFPRDFPQCYDTYDCSLLNSIGEKFGLQKEGETAFMDAHLLRVQALPGRERFRTGISLRVPFKKLPELSRSGLPEDRSPLFISVPYLGKYVSRIPLGPESESVRLLDFKQLRAKVPYRSIEASEEERDDIGEILVHQARYMIFDNRTRRSLSCGDSYDCQLYGPGTMDNGEVPSLLVQTGLSLFPFRQRHLALIFEADQEEDIDQLISSAKTYDNNQGMVGIPADGQLPAGVSPTENAVRRAREENVRKGKQSTCRDLLTSLNRLSAALFAAIGVAERQIVVLQDIHNLFSASCRTKVREFDQRYRSGQNPFHKTSAPIPVLSENPEQIFPAILDTIDEVVHERKSFILKIRELVENVDISRKMA
ncbi:hypothetical protein HOY80DRAFT_1107870 [Tuber brumale]|nr:hypothetical protein HOY80DRAFT_1107870 [Tuber brumale]